VADQVSSDHKLAERQSAVFVGQEDFGAINTPLPHHAGAAKLDGNVMAKLTMPAEAAKALSVRERVLLFCTASRTDWLHAGVTGETVTAMVVKGLFERDAAGVLILTDRGRAVFRALLPDL
jgi:hypothetical protein